MALLKFLKGNYSNLSNAAINEGQVLICGDTGEMFVDVAADKRVKIGDFVVISDINALEALDASAVPTSRLYYVEDGNILARSNGTTWIQINKQKTLAELGGVSKTIYDEKVAALAKADQDNATAIENLNNKVGSIPNGEDGQPVAASVIAYVDKKTAGIASDAALAELTGRVTTAEGEIDALQEALAEGGDTAKAIGAAQAAAEAAQDAVDTLAGKVGEVAEGKTVVGLIGEVQAQADKGVADAATAQAKADSAYTLAEGRATIEQVNSAIANAGHAVKADVDQAIADLDAAYKKADGDLKSELEGKINAKVAQSDYDAKVAELAGADTTLQGNIDALAGKVGEVPADKTVVQMIADAQTAATYDDTKVKEDIKANADAIDAIEADYLKVADKTALQDQITANANAIELLTNGVKADEVDGVNDLINYVKEHGPEVLAMQEDIAENAKAIADQATSDAATYETKTDAAQKLTDAKAYTDTEVGKLAQADTDNLAAAKKYTDDEIAELNIAQYAKQADVDTAIANVNTEAANKDAVVLAEAQKGINAVQANLDAVDGRVTTAEGKITALETASATHALKTEVEAVQSKLDEYKTSNDAAVALKADASVVSAMDTAYKAADTALSDRIKNLEDNKAGYATTGEVATAKSEAISAAEAKATELDNALKATLQAEIDADVKALADGQVATNKADIASLVEQISWGEF